MSNIVFSDTFTVTNVDSGIYERVTRVSGISSDLDMSLQLDVNSDLYPLAKDNRFTLALAPSLQAEGDKDSNAREAWRPGKGGIADDYEYVMFGKVFKFDEGTGENVTAYASFGGLLMALGGAYRHLRDLSVGNNVYLLIRKA